MLQWGALGLTILAISACATGKAAGRAESAAKRGDWDTAVAYYREALGRDPKRLDLRVALEHAMHEASSVHLKRARDLEAQEQLPGAAAEYRLAASLDPVNAFALSKAIQLEKTLRDQAEANRPLSRIDEARQQAAQAAQFPRLDPRTRVSLSFPRASVQSILSSIAELGGITVQYDANLSTQLNNSYQVSFTDTPIEEALTQVLTANTMWFKITGPKSIFIYQDTSQNRQKYEDQFFQMFYISHAEVGEVAQILQQMTTTGPTIRPVIQVVKTANALSVRATAPVMSLIANMIAMMDKPRAEVIIEVEILEVDRTRAKQLGVDLSQYALGLTFSPAVAPPNTAAAPNTFPTMPPPINLNTLSRGVSSNDFYLTVPTMQIKLLESDAKTRLLANPQLRGREGLPMTLSLGESVPIIQTQLLSGAAGGVPTVPQQSIQYRNVGVNLSLTPKVTYQDEIIIDSMTVDKSGIGGEINVGGNNYQKFVTRQAVVNLRLRDGESSLLAGLILDEDRKTWASLPGILHIPFFRNLFGSSTSSLDQSDIVMIVTPHIIRSHDITASDLKPLPLGSGPNFGIGGVPTLIAPGGAPPPSQVPLTGATPPAAGTTPPTTGQPPVTGAPPTPPPATTPPSTTTNPGVVRVVPVTPVGGAETTPPPTGPGQVILSTPGGEFSLAGGPYPVPIQLANVSQVKTVTLTITYNPAVLKAVTVNPGTFLQQGGVTTSFTAPIDVQAGRIVITAARTGDASGVSTVSPALFGAIQFTPVAAGTSQISVTAVVMNAAGQPIAVQTAPANVVVK